MMGDIIMTANEDNFDYNNNEDDNDSGYLDDESCLNGVHGYHDRYTGCCCHRTEHK